MQERTWTVGGREISLGLTADGDLTVTEGCLQAGRHRRRVVALGGRWRSRGRSGRRSGDYELALTGRSLETFAVPVALDAEAQRVQGGGDAGGAWARRSARARWRRGSGRCRSARASEPETAVGAVFARECLDRLPLLAANGLRRFRVGAVDGDSVALVVERDLEPDERGGVNQRRLRTSFYPLPARARAPRRGGLRLLRRAGVLGQPARDPRGARPPRGAVRAPLGRPGRGLSRLPRARWRSATAAGSTTRPLPAPATSWATTTGRAGSSVGRTRLPADLARSSAQAARPRSRRPAEGAARLPPRADAAGRRTGSTSSLPAPYATPILAEAFPFAGEVIETGLPRTDLLLRPDRERGRRGGKAPTRRRGQARRPLRADVSRPPRLPAGRRPGVLRDQADVRGRESGSATGRASSSTRTPSPPRSGTAGRCSTASTGVWSTRSRRARPPCWTCPPSRTRPISCSPPTSSSPTTRRWRSTSRARAADRLLHP